jgi:Tol biopolymer transport system component
MKKFVLAGSLALVAMALFVLPAGAKVGGPNGRIAFSRATPDFQDSNTYTMNPDGSDVQPLFPFGSGSPRWSPDGTEVAVTTSLGAPCDPDCTIYTAIINPDTGNYRLITANDPPFVGAVCWIWSPDASHFACDGENDSGSANGLYTVRSSDGGGLTRLTNAGVGMADIPIDYSPDGTQIVFGRVDAGDHHCTTRSALYVVNTDGSGLHRITPWGFCDDDGSWSPDGTKIAFATGGRFGRIWLVQPDGTGLRQIPIPVSGWSGLGDVSWSPDGTKIAFILGGAKTPEGIYTANVNGTDLQQVTSSPTFDHETDWGSHPLVR